MALSLARALAAVPAFDEVGADRLRALTKELVPLTLRKGRTLFRQGDEGQDLFIVLSGKLTVVLADEAEHRVAELGPGSLAGEIAPTAGGLRSATVRTAADTRLARLPAASFRALLADYPSMAERFAEEARRRVLETQLSQVIGHVFGRHDEDLLDRIKPMIELVRLAAGDILFKQGDPADAAYIVAIGRLRMATAEDDASAFDEVGRGALVGSAALLDGATRSATAFATRDTYLVRLPNAVFDALAETHPRSMLTMTRSLLANVKAPGHRHESRRQTTIAVVAATDDIDLRVFASELVAALSRTGPTFHMWSARADDVLGRPGIAHAGRHEVGHIVLSQWLHDIEDRHETVVYEADRSWTPWTSRIVRQADRVLIVARAANPTPGAIEQQLHELLPTTRRPRLELVLLQSPGTELPRDTARALAVRDVDDHYHVRAGSRGDMERLARIIAGRAVAVVLSGGGARGFAHLGVLRALDEAGVPVDVLGGSSIGAVISMGAATGMPLPDLVGVVRERFSGLKDFTLPVVSLLKGKRTAHSMAVQFGDLGIEDLWLPAFALSTDVGANRATVHRRGPIVRALRASTAIPGVFPPVPIDGALHIDGGILSNLPIDEMRRWRPDATIIAVDLVPAMEHRAQHDYGLWVSGWTAASQRLRPKPRRKRLPGLADTMVRATVVASTRDRDRMVEEGIADLYVPLDLRGVDFLDFEMVEPLVERGYELAKPHIAAWVADAGAGHVLGGHG